MNVLDQIRSGASNLFETLNEGWSKLMTTSGRAVTRFTRREPAAGEGAVPTESESWGFLAGEIAETGEHLEVRLEAPGMNREDFDIRIEGRTLVIRGEKRFERDEREPSYHLFEASYGSFERALTLPCHVATEGAEATYKRGILSVRLPKSDPRPARTISVS
jgi:HSP20 family protein